MERGRTAILKDEYGGEGSIGMLDWSICDVVKSLNKNFFFVEVHSNFPSKCLEEINGFS